MRAARDSFLHFLADNLTGIEVRNLRRDPDSPESSQIKPNAVNVQFIGDNPEVNVGSLLATIDVVHENELSAVDIEYQVFKLLSTTGYCAQKDYSQSPATSLGSNLYWNPNGVSFRPVYSDVYFRSSCLLSLSYHPY